MTVSTEVATIPVLKAPGLHPSRHAFALFAELVRDSNNLDGLDGEDEALLYALTGSLWGSSSHILPRSLRRDLRHFRNERCVVEFNPLSQHHSFQSLTGPSLLPQEWRSTIHAGAC